MMVASNVLPLARVEGPGPDRVGPHLLGDLAGGAHAQLDVTEDCQVGLFAGAVQEQDVALLGLHVGEPRLRVGSSPHDISRGVRKFERHQRRHRGGPVTSIAPCPRHKKRPI